MFEVLNVSNLIGATTFDGVAVANIEEKPAPEAVNAAAVGREGWTCTADSENAGTPCQNAIDGDPNTIWHTQYEPDNAALPHQITIDMQQAMLIDSITYQPRTDGGNGNIGQTVVSTR